MILRTISIRFTDKFATDKGTIAEHQNIINDNGYVWYGKLGTCPSLRVQNQIMGNFNPRILLIHSGKMDRYWLYISEISKNPEVEYIPGYYRKEYQKFGCWFKVTKIEQAHNNVISKCVVASSGVPLGEASKHSMSPYFIIDYEGDE